MAWQEVIEVLVLCGVLVVTHDRVRFASDLGTSQHHLLDLTLVYQYLAYLLLVILLVVVFKSRVIEPSRGSSGLSILQGLIVRHLRLRLGRLHRKSSLLIIPLIGHLSHLGPSSSLLAPHQLNNLADRLGFNELSI